MEVSAWVKEGRGWPGKSTWQPLCSGNAMLPESSATLPGLKVPQGWLHFMSGSGPVICPCVPGMCSFPMCVSYTTASVCLHTL